MRDLLLLVGVIAVLAISGAGQDAGDARAAIRKIIDDQQAAWNRQDLEGFMAGYWNSPDLTFFSGAHESKGWQAALDRYKKNYQGAGHEMGKLEFRNLWIEILGPEAAFTEIFTTEAQRNARDLKAFSPCLCVSVVGLDPLPRLLNLIEAISPGWLPSRGSTPVGIQC